MYILDVPYSDTLPEHFTVLRNKIEELDDTIRNFSRKRKMADSVPSLCIPGSRFGSLVVADVNICDTGNIIVRFWDNENFIDMELDLNPVQLRELVNVLSAWKLTIQTIESISPDVIIHPSITIERARDNIISASVNKSFLEKSDIHWWKVQDLIAICGHRSGIRADKFRSYFLYILPHVLELIRNRKIKHTIIRELPFAISDHIVKEDGINQKPTKIRKDAKD
jgi:hypothetical protein